jgi:hypothetical protein
MEIEMATTTAKKTSAPITAISKYRALMLVCAVEQGWTHSQPATSVDQYKKGGDTLTLAWGGRSLVGYTWNAEGITHGQGSMLQRAQAKLGKPMGLDKKWPKLTPAQTTKLEGLARGSFLVK